MRLRVGIRVAGHTKSSYTYLQLLEDLVGVSSGPAALLEAGFVDYRMVPVNIKLPPPEMEALDRELYCEIAAVKLRSELHAGIGVDPRKMSGRLAVVAWLGSASPPEHSDEVADRLRGLGYRVDVLDEGPP
jgi:hypothetical protein